MCVHSYKLWINTYSTPMHPSTSSMWGATSRSSEKPRCGLEWTEAMKQLAHWHSTSTSSTPSWHHGTNSWSRKPQGRDLGKVPNKDLPEWWDNQMRSNTDQSGMDQINHMSCSKASRNQKYIAMPTRPRSTQHCYFVRPLFEGLFIISGAPWWDSLCEWLARNYMSRHLENVSEISMSGKST